MRFKVCCRHWLQTAAHDCCLLNSYSSADQITARRDDQLAILDARTAIAEKSLARSRATLQVLRERAEVEAEFARDVARFLELTP